MIRKVWQWFWRPSSRFAWGGILLAGGLSGALLLGGFNFTVGYFDSLEFCISCHEMDQLVFQEYKETIHYSNRHGVRASCSDCHVPKQWFGKVWRKALAMNELYHKIRGTVNTPEKFEAKRLEMAEHVWAYMEATDSRECRNCHSYEAMRFHEQNELARDMMQLAKSDDLTCIACHKGVAHRLPNDYE